jgi:hypothetical protein
MLDAHQAATVQTYERPPHSKFLSLNLLSLICGAVHKFVHYVPVSGLVMHYLPFSHNLCATNTLERKALSFGLAHRVRERMNVPGPTRWHR